MNTTDTPIFDRLYAEADETTQRLVLTAVADKPHESAAWAELDAALGGAA